MLATVKGYYNGNHIVISENVNLNIGQEVMITILDTESVPKKKIDLKKYMGKGEKMFQTDAQDYIKEMRRWITVLSHFDEKNLYALINMKGKREEYTVVLIEALNIRPCLKNVKTPKRRIFFRHSALNFLAGRQPACENLP